MKINFSYDASVASAPADFTAALNAVAQSAALYFTDPITINIQVGWGEVGGQPLSQGAIGESLGPPSIRLNYAQLKTELMQTASSIDDVIAIKNLPASDPTGGGLFLISRAEAKAWGLLPANSTPIDGVIGFSTTPNWDFNPSDGISAGFFDFMGTAEHEVTHALGRVIGTQFTDLLDLFDYSSPGHLAGSRPGYFAIDGGKTPLNHFSTSGDSADWDGTAGVDANNAFATPSQVNPFTLTDFREMDVLGFNLNFGNLNLSSANNVALPALTTYQSMYAVQPSSTELWNLKVFDANQSIYAQSIKVQDATVYMYAALGQALADRSDTGSTAFKSTWGPQAISSDVTFVAQAYAHVFGVQGTQAQIQGFVDQVNFFDKIYTASGAFGTDANEIDLLARGAIYGQMLGVKAEIPSAVASAASALTDTPLIGVSAQHDMTHGLV
jgi:hypothetical protein